MKIENGLDAFGQALMPNVPDRAIEEISDMLTGTSKAPADIEFREKLLSRLNEKDLDLLHELSVLSIHKVLFYLMVFIEEHSEITGIENISPKLQFLIEDPDTMKDIIPLSDGLGGEYIGWVWDHSKFQNPAD